LGEKKRVFTHGGKHLVKGSGGGELGCTFDLQKKCSTNKIMVERKTNGAFERKKKRFNPMGGIFAGGGRIDEEGKRGTSSQRFGRNLRNWKRSGSVQGGESRKKKNIQQGDDKETSRSDTRKVLMYWPSKPLEREKGVKR